MTELSTIANVSDAAVIRDLADRAAARERLEISNDTIGFVLEAGQSIETFNLEEQYDTPTRKRGAVTLGDAGSFAGYVNRHAHPRGTTLWGDVDNGTLTAVLDDHQSISGSAEVDVDPGDPGWAQHRATLRLRQTEDWKHWLKRDGQLMSQDDFAEHIEDGVDAIVTPDAATMLEIAQTFHAKTGATMESGRRLSGEVQFTYSEETTARAGRGQFEVPEVIELALAPFEGNEPYPITARLRFRLADGNLRLGYRLIRPDRIRRQAFDDVVAQVSAAADLPVMAGTPRSA